MKPRRLPLVESTDPHHLYLLIPGLDLEGLQGTEFQVNLEQGVLNVYCYRSGFDEEGDCEGLFFPVKLSDEDFKRVQDIQTLEVVNPRDLDRDRLGKEDYDRIREEMAARGFGGPGDSAGGG